MAQRDNYQDSPLFILLETKLESCHNDEGELNIAAISRRIRHTRQSIQQHLQSEKLSPGLAFYLLVAFEKELKLRDLVPFVPGVTL